MEFNIEELKEAVKGAVGDMKGEHAKQMKEVKEAAEKALDDIKKFGTLQTESNVKLTEAGVKLQELQANLIDTQQKLDKIEKGAKFAGPGGETKSIAAKITESDQYKAAKTSGRPHMDAVDVGSFRKTAIVNATGLNQPLVQPTFAPFVMPQNRPLLVEDLLPHMTTESNLIEYVTETAFTNNAAVVYSSPAYENVTKPESAITFQLNNAPIVTLAHWIPASRQVLSDAKMLQGYIESRLLYGLDFVEEDEVLNGDGSAGHLNGLMHQATAYAGAGAVSADQQLDTLLRAMTQVWTGSLFAPDGVVINPIDWTKIRLLKDTQGRYIFGDPNTNQQPSVWGQRLVASLSMAQTRFLVGAFRPGATLWDREQSTIRIAEQHADFFVKNMVVILAEERLGLTVYRPQAFVRGNFN